MDSQNTCPPETGGILGGQNEIITVEHFDRGMQTDRMCSYIPNIKELNDVIKQWQMKTISFIGIYHTHFWSVETLSEADKRYIDKILENMPLEFKRLYFPKNEKKSYDFTNYYGSIIFKSNIVKIYS